MNIKRDNEDKSLSLTVIQQYLTGFDSFLPTGSRERQDPLISVTENDFRRWEKEKLESCCTDAPTSSEPTWGMGLSSEVSYQHLSNIYLITSLSGLPYDQKREVPRCLSIGKCTNRSILFGGKVFSRNKWRADKCFTRDNLEALCSAEEARN